MQFNISRDFLDGLSLTQPNQTEENKELKANGGLHFLPSSPDSTMHTAVVSFTLQFEGQDRPFAQGGWRFLFTSSEKYEPKEDKNSEFQRSLLVHGAGKIIAALNNLCMHANLPLVPVDPQRLAGQTPEEA